MKQIFYTTENISKIYLSPYIKVSSKTDDTIYLVNTLTNVTVRFSGEEDVVSKLIYTLENGEIEENIILLLNKLSPKVDILLLYQKGFLE